MPPNNNVTDCEFASLHWSVSEEWPDTATERTNSMKFNFCAKYKLTP